MGSPEKPIDVELADMNPEVTMKSEKAELEPLNSPEKNEESVRFTGLTKEELMEVANQPNWKRARMVLFILFWVIWVVMLISAVFIVINAEKCKPIPQVQWYQDTAFVKFDPARFGGLKELAGKTEYFKDMKSSIVLKNVVTDWEVNKDVSEVTKEAHKKGVMVLVDFPVSSIKTSSGMFNAVRNNCTKDASTANCDLFVWRNDTATGFVQTENMDEYYKGTEDSAEVNFNSDTAINLLTEKLEKAIKDSQVDGFLLTDTEKLWTGYNGSKVLDAAFKKVNGTTYEQNEDNHLMALFVEAHSDDAAMAMNKHFHVPNNSTESLVAPSPIVLQSVVKSADPEKIKTNFENSRESARVFHAYQTSFDFDGMSEQESLAISMLNVALPGVSFIDLGEEIGNRTAEFKTEKDINGHNKQYLKAMTDLIKKKTVNTLSKHSMRYDTQNLDTVFEWLNLETKNDNQKMIGFCKKWGKKEPVFVVSNFGNTTVANVTMNFSDKCGSKKDTKITTLVSNNKYDFVTNTTRERFADGVQEYSTSMFWLKKA